MLFSVFFFKKDDLEQNAKVVQIMMEKDAEKMSVSENG